MLLDLDGAWNGLDLRRVDARAWGPRLRFSTPAREAERFYREVVSALPDFVLYGSGDFHHLSGLLSRRVREPVTLVSFDNHPDWDVRPPRWACGGWVNRALENPQVKRVSVWGCGNFECWWPGQIFGNRRAEKSGRLEVHPWADDKSPRRQRRRGAILRANWRERFAEFACALNGSAVYVTIDMDCLAPDLAWTNWENGKFTYDGLRWALQTLREHSRIIAGDMCGAYSAPTFARRKQRFVSQMDHPKLNLPLADTITAVNRAAFDELWPALTQ